MTDAAGEILTHEGTTAYLKAGEWAACRLNRLAQKKEIQERSQ